MSSMSNATIIRAKHSTENPYFQMLRKTAQDENLSWEARGVVAYLLSKPDDWEIQVKDLQQQCGRDKVYKIIKDLIEAGYIEDRVKYTDDKGHIKYTPYKLHETPRKSKIIKLETAETPTVEEVDKADDKPIDNPLPENPYTVKPYTDEPYTENTDVYIEENVDNTDKHKKEEKKKDDPSSSDLSEVSNLFEANIGLITPMLREQLSDLIETYTKQWVVDAFGVALKRGVRKLTYIEGILRNWQLEGRKEDKPQKDNSPVDVVSDIAPTPAAEMFDPFAEPEQKESA